MKPPPLDEPPPFLGTWGRVYWAVGIYLCLVILALAIFTKMYNQ